uniref:Ubiquitin carboxyl-terminal hydrolase n=1 Tax=Oryza punctata TaxID=4537 RepID=A0A0E0KWH7_ORYPU
MYSTCGPSVEDQPYYWSTGLRFPGQRRRGFHGEFPMAAVPSAAASPVPVSPGERWPPLESSPDVFNQPSLRFSASLCLLTLSLTERLGLAVPSRRRTGA